MKLLNLFKKPEQNKKTGKFAEFFLYAPEIEKKKVIRAAAQRANEEQRELIAKSAH
jgi:hypothetical protein